MRRNKTVFEELLQSYEKQKIDYEQKEKEFMEAYDAWFNEVETNGDRTEEAIAFGTKFDKAAARRDASRAIYNALAHQVLQLYVTLN